MSSELGQQTYDDAIVIDGLNVSRWDSPAVYDSLDAGGVTAINATVAVWEGFREGMDNVEDWLHRFKERSETLVHGTSVADIIKAKAEGKTAVILGWQNASPIENRIDRLELFHALGLRIIQVTYNERNLLGNGCYERTDEGLSRFGVDAIQEMNRLGILIDLSHVGDQTTLETAEISNAPVSATHSNARSFVDHPRNKTDDALKLIAEKGGVIGANAFPLFLKKGYESTVGDYVDAIEDLVERVGIDHVGVGTDYTQDQPHAFFDWLWMQQGTKTVSENPVPESHHHPYGMETPSTLSTVAQGLANRGYSTEDITKVMGGNWLRLFEIAWAQS